MNPFDELEALSKSEIIPGGRASGKPDKKYDDAAVERGKKIEMEHVKGGSYPKDAQEKVAEEIARDHLEEHPCYYDEKEGLPKMESELSELGKAGGGEGQFRGGDPEYAQMKQVEAREEAADSGVEQEGEAGGEMDEPDESAIEADQDKKDAKQEKMASLGKGGPSISMGSQQVSPVDTDEDYFDDKDPSRVARQRLEFRGKTHPYVEPTAINRPEHQHEVWSEALGYKIPLEGNPSFYLRRFTLAGDKEGYDKARKEVFKALEEDEEQEPEEQESEEQEESNEPGAKPSPQMLLQHLNEFDKDQLVQISRTIWGKNFKYDLDWMDEDYIRNDVRGSLMDIIEKNEVEKHKSGVEW